MSFPVGPQPPPLSGGLPDQPAGFPPPPPPPSNSRWWLWLLAGGSLLLLSPFCCCGGLLFYASTFRDFEISNGEHLGGPLMNVRFDYELHNDRPLFDAYFIVARSADGATRERNIWGSLARQGTFHFSMVEVGPRPEMQGPLDVWIEKEDMRGNRSRASNVIRIYPKAA